MSGGETDDEANNSGTAQGDEEKAIRRIPVCWLNSQVVDMLHTVDTWMQFEEDEKLANGDKDRRGNRPLKKIARDQPPRLGRITRKLPTNWYDEVWLMSLAPGKRSGIQAKANEPIPNPVLINIALLMTIY